MDKPIPHLVATDLIARLRAAGFTVRSDRGRLKVSPISTLPADLKDELTTHRVAVLDVLEREIDAIAREDAITRRACQEDPFDVEDASPVQLVSYDLVKISSPGEPPKYEAFPAGYLDSLEELSRVEKKTRQEKQARRDKRQRKKSG